MYSVNKKQKNKGKLIDKMELVDIDGFYMASTKKVFKVNGCNIRKIRVVSKKLANPLVSEKVENKFNSLITYLTDLLIESDDNDDSGDGYREALNQIERFRLIIKNKYRDYLTRVQLEKMSKKLKLLQKEAKERMIELSNSYLEENTNNRSR